jgi:alpha-1,3-rhamnosyl/mannosyltransferase
MIGVVPDEDLPALYQSADLFVMPSLAEGFNLPLAQAFASKVPAVAANSPASREIAGQAAQLVDGASVDAIATAIISVLSDKSKRDQLIAKGVEQQSQFKWDDAASRLLSIYSRFV